jgi:hypothetical protein
MKSAARHDPYADTGFIAPLSLATLTQADSFPRFDRRQRSTASAVGMTLLPLVI